MSEVVWRFCGSWRTWAEFPKRQPRWHHDRILHVAIGASARPAAWTLALPSASHPCHQHGVTDYGHTVEEPREAVRRARTAAGLSVRALAEIAGISPTTVTRIEAGRVDPGWSTLRKVLAAAGEEAVLTTRRLPAPPSRQPSSNTLAGLSDAWHRTARGDTPDWTRLRGALDVLAQHPEALPDALAPRPQP